MAEGGSYHPVANVKRSGWDQVRILLIFVATVTDIVYTNSLSF